VTENRYRAAQEARRDITHTYHPFSLDNGEKQTPVVIKAELEKSYVTLETIAKEAGSTDKQKKN
jgi:hypothetical protein